MIRRGDIGVVMASHGDTCAIRVDNGWIAPGLRSGLTMSDWPCAAAWRVPGRGDLQQFLCEATMRRFRPGRTDCAMLIADWVWCLTGSDPAAALRGTYRSASGWRSHIDAAGGLVALVDRLAAGAGLTKIYPRGR